MQAETTRRRSPRLTLVLPPDHADALGRLAEAHFRDRKREALRLLTEAIDREHGSSSRDEFGRPIYAPVSERPEQ